MTSREVTERLETYSIGEKIDADGRLLAPAAPNSKESTAAESMEVELEGISSRKSLYKRFKELVCSLGSFFTDSYEALKEAKQKLKQEKDDGVTIRWNYKWEIIDPEWFTREREEVFMPDSDTVKIILLIIDPQNDFHDDPEIDGKCRGYTGSLAVPGATHDSLRLSEMIRNNIHDIDEIYVTLDTHHVCTVMNPVVLAV